MKKKHYVLRYRRGHYVIWHGTLDKLVEAFSYTLQCGNSYNNRISRQPKTIKSFLSNVNKSFDAMELRCYDKSYVEIATPEQIKLYKIEELG